MFITINKDLLRKNVFRECLNLLFTQNALISRLSLLSDYVVQTWECYTRLITPSRDVYLKIIPVDAAHAYKSHENPNYDALTIT